VTPTTLTEDAARGHAAPPTRSRWPSGWRGAGIALAVVLLVTLWIISPRFSIGFPSLVDDWFAIDNAPNAMEHLVRLDYVPEEVRDPRRYRPVYNAVWAWLQWHTLDAPSGMVGPNLWNLLRVTLLAGGIVLLIYAAVPARRRAGPWLPVFAALAPLVLIATPSLAFNVARFEPGEPLMVGGMVVGGWLMILGARRWLQRPRWTAVVPLLVVGWLLWLLGVYEKEAAICFLVLAPFLHLHLERQAREEGVVDVPLWRRPPVVAVWALALVPVLHLLWEVRKIAAGGETVYGAEIERSAAGFLDQLHASFVAQWRGILLELGTVYLAGLCLAVCAAVIASGLTRRRVPWLTIGLVLCGWALLVFQGLGGELAPRYYIPTIALFVAALALAMLDAPVLVRWVGVAATVWFLAGHIGPSHRVVSQLADAEQFTEDAIRDIGTFHPGGCPVYMGHMEQEYAEAVPVLVDLVPGEARRDCAAGYEAIMVRGKTGVTAIPTNERIHRACEAPGWRPLRSNELFQIRGCGRLREGEVAGQPVSEILDHNRLVPGVPLSQRT
jgi:hypothetical protein